jgi:hypothetical protein
MNINQATANSKLAATSAPASRQVYRQAERDNEKVDAPAYNPERKWRHWETKWQITELVSVIRPGAPIAPGSTVKEGGKTPGYKTPDGWVGLGGKWYKTDMTEAEIARAIRDGATVGHKASCFPPVDIDIDDASHAQSIARP